MKLLPLFLLASLSQAATYYVDFDQGNDANNGLSQTAAWKHAPGDPQAGGQPAATQLQGGDVVQFKGGVVYRGSVAINASGAEGARIHYKGAGWGEQPAVVDGSDLITGWQACQSPADAGGADSYRNLFYATIPADRSPFLLNLHEIDPKTGEDQGLFIAQSPTPEDPFFFDRREGMHPVKHENLTLNSLAAPDFFTQSDPDYWAGASILVWVNPNATVRQEIQEYIPAENRVVFTEALGKNAIYPDGRDQFFAIYNHPTAIDAPGEYAVLPPGADGQRKVVLWPRNRDNLDGRISGSVRKTGFDTGDHSHLEISGFEIRKHAGEALRDGSAILAYGGHSARLVDVVIRDNYIHSNKHATKGYGGIYGHGLQHSLIENNRVHRNPVHAGIFIAGCEDTIVRGNDIQHTGKTALRLYGCRRTQVVGNRLENIYATHANGITLYLGCYDVLVANNFVVKASTPITHQSSANLYFINNVTDGQDLYRNVNEWPVKQSGPVTTGRVVYLNNTFTNAAKDSSLSLGEDDDNEYIVINNILDGMSFDTKHKPKLTLHEYNLFLGRNFVQTEKYGWTDGVGETTSNAPLSAIFVDPDNYNFRLKPGSPAIGAGIDVSQYWPTETFPDFDFGADITGAKRTDWSLGAYAK